MTRRFMAVERERINFQRRKSIENRLIANTATEMVGVQLLPIANEFIGGECEQIDVEQTFIVMFTKQPLMHGERFNFMLTTGSVDCPCPASIEIVEIFA